MSNYAFGRVAEERAYYASVDRQRRQRNFYRAQAAEQRDVARLAGLLHRHYPHMPPGVVSSLASAGIRPGTPEADEFAQLSAEEQKDSGGLLASVTDVVGAPFKAAAKGVGAVADVVADETQDLARFGFTALTTPLEEFAGRAGEIVTGTGEVLSQAGTVVGGVAGGVVGSIVPVGGTVTGAAAGAALGGALGGFLGDVAGGGETATYSAGGIAARQALAGERVDLGSGFFPGGDVREQQAKIMREMGQAAGLDNRGFTIGRYFANAIFEPGSLPFNVVSGVFDAALQIYADPAAVGLDGYAAWKKSRNLLKPEDRVALAQVGLVDDVRKTVLPEKIHPLYMSDEFRPVREYLAGETNIARLRRNTEAKIPVEIMVPLIDAKTVDEVDSVLAPMFGTVLREKLPVPNAVRGNRIGKIKHGLTEGALTFGTPTYEIRALSRIPGRVLDLRNPDTAFATLDSYLLNAKIPEAQRAERLLEFARAYVDENPGELFQTVFRRTMGDVEKALIDAGTPAHKARQLTRIKGEAADLESRYFNDRLGENARYATPLMKDIGVEATDPHIVTELLNNVIDLPDFRAVRRHVSRFNRILTHPTVHLPRSFLESLTDQFWKPVTLLTRLAYPARVLPEEQARMAGVGLDSMFRHPASYIALATSKQADLFGKAFDDAPLDTLTKFQQALVRDRSGWVGQPIGVAAKGVTLVDPSDVDNYVDTWAGLIAKYASDPVLRDMATGGVGDEVFKSRFWDGDMASFREFLMSNPKHGNLQLKEVSDLWIDSFRERLMLDTMEDADLLSVVATGKLPRSGEDVIRVRAADRNNIGTILEDRGDTALVRFVNKREGTQADIVLPKKELTPLDDGSDRVLQAFAGEKHLDIHPRLKQFLREKVERGETPGILPGDLWLSRGGELAQFYNRLTDKMFSLLMASPTNKLNRSKTFQQFYWNRVPELMPTLKAGEQAEIIAEARKAGLPKRIIKQLREAAQKGGDGSLTKGDVDTLAKGFALDETKNLLFDLSEKSQFFDALRVAFPFGDAWLEVLGRWARITKENPRVIRRVQQGIGASPQVDAETGEVKFGGTGLSGGAIGETLSRIPGLSETYAPGRGFFYENENGQEVFAYPFSGFFMDKVAKTPIPLEGRLAGLNLVSEVLPGVGPVVQFPAAFLVDEHPDWNAMREFLFPFGEPDLADPAGEVLPAWIRRFKNASDQLRSPEEQRIFSSTVGHVLDWMVANGEIDMSDSMAMSRGVREATDRAKKVYAFRAVAQMAVPSSPSPKWLVADKSGALVSATLLRQEFQQLLREQPDTAMVTFLNRHGPQAFLLTQPYSQSLVYEAPVTKAGVEWVVRNPEIKDALPDIYGFFAPVSENPEDFDYETYAAQFTGGERQSLTGDQILKSANNRLARNIFDYYKSKVGPRPTDSQRAALRELQERLVVKYPGYTAGFGGVAGVGKRLSARDVIPQFERALTDPRVAQTVLARPQGEALAVFMKAWNEAKEAAQKAGLRDHTTSKKFTRARAALRELSARLSLRFDGWAPIFDQVFDRAMNDDLDTMEVAA